MLKNILVPVNITFFVLIIVVAVVAILAYNTSIPHFNLAAIAAGTGFVVVVTWLGWTLLRGEA